MFYNKKWIFFIFVYVASFVLYFFLDDQLLFDAALKGVFSHPIKGSITIFAFIIFSSDLVSIIISAITLALYRLNLTINKMPAKKMFLKTSWMLFTIFVYVAIAVSFFEMIKY
jgi:uncharacterized metal-binding protein